MCMSFPEWFIYENNCTLAGYNIFKTFASSAKDKFEVVMKFETSWARFNTILRNRPKDSAV